jgi:hypothetical protein
MDKKNSLHPYAFGMLLGFTPAFSNASQLDGALDAAVSGEQYLNISAVPMYQNALRDNNDTGNYTFDVIGKFTLMARPTGTFGNTDLILWMNSSDKLGGVDSAPDMAAEAGLLWDTNDIGSDSSSTTPLVLAIDQWFLDNKASVGVGKYFPGQAYLTSAYTADNSNSFTSKMISSNPVVSWWEALGIGMNGGRMKLTLHSGAIPGGKMVKPSRRIMPRRRHLSNMAGLSAPPGISPLVAARSS